MHKAVLASAHRKEKKEQTENRDQIASNSEDEHKDTIRGGANAHAALRDVRGWEPRQFQSGAGFVQRRIARRDGRAWQCGRAA